jgi:UDP-glucose 4-epimerase
VRVVVVGATGNVGLSLVRALSRERRVERVVAVARRRPPLEIPKVEWVEADVVRSDLLPVVRGAKVVVHLAWHIQPSRDLNALWRTNVEGSSRLFRAVAQAGVPALVYASSVGVYSRGPKQELVDESWPRDGIASSFYGLHKAEVERRLDRFEQEVPEARVVRLRPALTFKRESASGQRRLFAGPLVPTGLLRSRLVPLVPDIPGLRFQAVHTEDVAEAYRLAIVSNVRGAFNVAADPVIDPPLIAELVRARPIRLPAAVFRGAMWLTWHLRLQPSPPGWADLALGTPLLDSSRARAELGWEPRHSGIEALRELVEGLRERVGASTPPLSPDAGGPLRLGELASGVGARGTA